jgi:hypothetical protein
MSLFIIFLTVSLLIGVLFRRQQLWITGVLIGVLSVVVMFGYYFLNQI